MIIIVVLLALVRTIPLEVFSNIYMFPGSYLWRSPIEKDLCHRYFPRTYSEFLQTICRLLVDSCFSLYSLHKKWSFPLRIFSVNVTKSAVSCEFGHIYWRNPYWKTSFFCAVVLRRYRGEYKHQQFMPIVSLHNPWKHQKIWKPEVLWCYQRI